MRTIIKLAAVTGVLATLVACGSPAQEEVVFVPTVQMEPVTTKY